MTGREDYLRASWDWSQYDDEDDELADQAWELRDERRSYSEIAECLGVTVEKAVWLVHLADTYKLRSGE